MAGAAATVRVYQRLSLYSLQSQGTSGLVVWFVVKEQALKARATDWSERAEHTSSPGLTQLRGRCRSSWSHSEGSKRATDVLGQRCREANRL